MVKIAFDIGGVLSKYPALWYPIVKCLHRRGDDTAYGVEVHIISDMHPKEKVLDMLARNGLSFIPADRVHSSDYKCHGEACKAETCAALGVDILVDDFPGYVATPGKPLVRLLVMPDPSLPYYADEWKTDGSEGDFGRRNPAGSKRPPEGR